MNDRRSFKQAPRSDRRERNAKNIEFFVLEITTFAANMGIIYFKSIHTKCTLQEVKYCAEFGKMGKMARMMYPMFECIDCNHVMAVCRLCAKCHWITNKLGNELIGRNHYYYGNAIKDFYRHLLNVHDYSQYLTISRGEIYFVGHRYGNFLTEHADPFLRVNPHVLLVETDGFHYINERKKLIDGKNGDEKYPLSSSQIIINGNNSCVNCGWEYETFPTCEECVSHMNSCMQSAVMLLREHDPQRSLEFVGANPSLTGMFHL